MNHLLVSFTDGIIFTLNRCKMIVPSMNTAELVKEIQKDLPMVDQKAIHLCEAHRRKAVKSKEKKYDLIIEYKSKRQNNWLIIICYFKGILSYQLIVYYLSEHGMNAISADVNEWYHLTSHFLTRYNERFLKQENISKLDLLKRFLTTNKVIEVESDYSKQVMICRFSEGIGLGIEEIVEYRKVVLHIRTFISNEMVFEEQQESIKRICDHYEKYGRVMQKATGIKEL